MAARGVGGTRGRALAPVAFALVAFAANSILCRFALRDRLADPASFALVRLGSGAVVLAALARGARGAGIGDGAARPRWTAALALFAYAATFSFAYTRLTAATGALILFASVQATMLAVALGAGERPRAAEGAGFALALAGLAWLLAPGLAAPDPWGAALMAVAGTSWGLYSLLGRRSRDPLRDTGRSFLLAVPPALLVWLAARGPRPTLSGFGLAVASGAIASGLGYVAWYAAVRRLTATRAAIVQLAVPALTALAGVALLGESFTLRLAASSALILGGVALAQTGRARAGARG